MKHPLECNRPDSGALCSLGACECGAQASPGIVVAGIKAHGVSVALQAFVKVFIGKVLVPCQGVGICEAGVQLQRPLKELEGIFVLLQTIMQSLQDTHAWTKGGGEERAKGGDRRGDQGH